MHRLRTLVFVVVMAMATPAAAATTAPEVINLPNGFFPEGVAIGEGGTIYAGSLIDGAIWRGDVRTGEGDVFVPGVPGRVAVGMKHDSRSGHLFVAGGPLGNAFVHDGDSGELVTEIPLGAGFVNDVVVTERAAYFTNSFVPELYEVSLSKNGALTGSVRTITLSGDFRNEAGQFNANGIEARGGSLIVVNSFFGELYRVNPATGFARTIDLGGAVVNGDGLVLVGRTLYAVEGGKNQVTEIRLAPGLGSGRVTGAITHPVFDVPTTAAVLGRYLYVVSAKFNTPPTPEAPYEIVRVPR
jgi:hypothetical protein